MYAKYGGLLFSPGIQKSLSLTIEKRVGGKY
jgi:hypothetical protein